MSEYIEFEAGQMAVSRLVDTVTPIVDKSSLSFLLAARGVSDKERDAFIGRKMHYGFAEYQAIPFLAFDFPGLAIFDCHLNFLAEPEGKRKGFLEEAERGTHGDGCGNIVQYFLVDAATGLLRGVRRVESRPEFIDGIKETCREQPYLHRSAREVDAAADKFLAINSTRSIMQMARMFKSGYSPRNSRSINWYTASASRLWRWL